MSRSDLLFHGMPGSMGAYVWGNRSVDERVKEIRAYGGCLGIRKRRRTWPTAISLGEE